MIFISVLLGLIDFSDRVILCSRTIVVANKALNVLICLYYPKVCFHERVAMTVKQILNMFFKPQPGLGPQCPICAGMLLSICLLEKTRLCLKETGDSLVVTILPTLL